MDDYLSRLAEFITDTPSDAIPPDVRSRASLIIADCVGCMAAGARTPVVQRLAAQFAAPDEAPSFQVPDFGQPVAVEVAAYLDGIAGTWHDLDEGNLHSRTHAGIQILPAALAESASRDLPQPDKERSAPTESSAARGYHRLESKNLAKTLGYDTPPDLREQFYIGPLDNWSHHYTRYPGAAFLYTPNIWPERPHDYREVFSTYYRTLESLGRRMMRVFAAALELPQAYFDDCTHHHFSTVPANNYPALARPALPDQLR